jgi:hypothetical protein
LVIIASAVVLNASLLARLNTLTMSVLDTTPTAMPSLSHTTTSGVASFAKISAASQTEASRLSTASRRRASSKMCWTRIINISPHDFARTFRQAASCGHHEEYLQTFLDQTGGFLKARALD